MFKTRVPNEKHAAGAVSDVHSAKAGTSPRGYREGGARGHLDFAGRAAVIVMIMLLCVGMLFPAQGSLFSYAASTDGSARVNASGGAYLRSKPSSSSSQVTLLSDNTKLTLIRETFTTTSTKATTRWYYVSASGRKGYIRSDLVDSISYANLGAKTTEALNYRTGPSTDMEKKGTLAKGKSLTVQLPARMNGNSMDWYRARIGSKSYYVSAAFVKIGGGSGTSGTKGIKVSGETIPTYLYVGQAFTMKGKIKSDKNIIKVVCGIANKKGDKWITSVRKKVGGKKFNIHDADADIKFGELRKGTFRYKVVVYTGKKGTTVIDEKFKVLEDELVAKLLANPKRGGFSNVIYTFSTENCSRVFGVNGYKDIHTTQGVAFTGKEYYVLYGTNDGQRIVTYTASGQRKTAWAFPRNIGHPNGITWDPITKRCYIFKGNQFRIYVWNPKTRKLSKSRTPYSSSGVGYDDENKVLVASSHTGMRVYSADGKFKHKYLFPRCTHTFFHYIQDCGAYGDIAFHGISGANKAKSNFLDFYRISTGEYLGTVKITIGEIESAVVDNDGNLLMLINTLGHTDYLWKTPLNVNDL